MNNKLEFFIALARARHFGRAAEECGVTQPTLSAGIRQLEDQLGVLLVQRGSRFQGLTPEGERVLVWARRIVADERAMREEMRVVKTGLSGHLRLAAIPTALSFTPKLTLPFRERHPGVTFSIRSATSDEILDLLENFEIDAGLTYLEDEPLGRVQTVPLYRESYYLVIPLDHPLATQERVTWHEAADLNLCLLTKDMQNRRIIDRHFREAGAAYTTMLESNSMVALFSHVMSGGWASVMPGGMVEAFGHGGKVATIELEKPEGGHMVGIVTALRDPATPLVSALLNVARSIAVRGVKRPA
jgi:DNA-binding transcriptional LysR family regulator